MTANALIQLTFDTAQQSCAAHQLTLNNTQYTTIRNITILDMTFIRVLLFSG
jgi:hypothetical protein